MEILLKNGAGNSQPDFIYWFQQKVVFNSQSYFISLFSNYMTNYPAYACRAKPIRPWVPSWDRLPMALATWSSHLTFMTWMDIASTQWDMSRVGPIEEPLIPTFLCQVKMESSITEELKKYTNSSFMVRTIWQTLLLALARPSPFVYEWRVDIGCWWL